MSSAMDGMKQEQLLLRKLLETIDAKIGAALLALPTGDTWTLSRADSPIPCLRPVNDSMRRLEGSDSEFSFSASRMVGDREMPTSADAAFSAPPQPGRPRQLWPQACCSTDSAAVNTMILTQSGEQMP